MTREQADLLKNVLYDSVNHWNTDVVFPATIEQMIDAKIKYCEERAEVFCEHRNESMCEFSYWEFIKQIDALKDLKTIMEGK